MKLEASVQATMRIAVKGDATVLILGPTGSGKTSLAREIHQRSPRRAQPFVSINLATLHEGTIESELFGHERGSFTGADQRRIGRLETADGGTVFLDEIGDLSPRLQARLLEFIQSKTITPVGSNREKKLNVRVIAATHRLLAEAVKKGSFREDLFHRLRVVTFQLPPLSERSEEFDEIVHACLTDICNAENRGILRISDEFAEQLEIYSWPGNIRELRNVLEYATLSSDGEELRMGDFPPWFNPQAPCADSVAVVQAALGMAEFSLCLNYDSAFADFEREFLIRALRRYRGRVNRTAREIGMNKTTSFEESVHTAFIKNRAFSARKRGMV